MKNYQDMIEKCKAEHGDKFDASDLDPRFIPYYENGQRVKVETMGEVLTGTIGKTTGWKPVFLLVRTSRSIGSPWTLGKNDKIVAVKRGKVYQAV